jgi:MFS family permease
MRKMLVICPAAFLTSLGMGITNLGMLFLIKDVFGASAAQVGMFGAFWYSFYMIGCIVLPRLIGSARSRSAMLVMLTVSACILCSVLAFPGLTVAFVAYSLYGFSTALFWPPLIGWLSRGLEGHPLNQATSLFSFSWSTGSVISSWLAGMLSERGKFLPVIMAVAIFGLNALFILVSRIWLRDPTEANDAVHSAARRVGRQPIGSVIPAGASTSDLPGQTGTAVDRSTTLRYPAWIGLVVIYVMMGVIANVFPVFARDELGLSESAVGLMLTVRSLAATIGFILLGRLHSWQFKPLLLPALSLFGALLVVAMAFQRHPLAFSGIFIAIGLLVAFTYNNSLFYATSGAPDKNRRASIHETLLTTGQIVGSLAGGILYQKYSLSLVFTIMAVLLLGGMVVQIFMIRDAGPGRGSGLVRP